MHTLLALALLGSPTALAQDAPAPAKVSWFKGIRYGVGGVVQVGAGTVGAPWDVGPVIEPAAFELRSYFSRHVAWHTTLNLLRMVLPPAARGEGRLDYDLHVAAHIPWDDHHEVVIGPGASIGYTFGGTYGRFVGDARLGVDVHGPNRWVTWGMYLRPFVGTARRAGDDGPFRLEAGALAEVAVIAHIPKRGERGAPRPVRSVPVQN